MSSINDRLLALASRCRAAAPGATIYAPDRAPASTDVYPVIEVLAHAEHHERTATQQWGNALHEQVGSHGPDKYCLCILQSPLKPRTDEQSEKTALYDLVEAIRGEITAHPELPDDNGDPTVLDAATYILTSFGAQGPWLLWHDVAYIGAVIVLDVVKLYAPAGG